MQPAKKKLLASTFLADRERHKKNFDALTSTRQFPDSKCQELFEKNNSKKKKNGTIGLKWEGRMWWPTVIKYQAVYLRLVTFLTLACLGPWIGVQIFAIYNQLEVS